VSEFKVVTIIPTIFFMCAIFCWQYVNVVGQMVILWLKRVASIKLSGLGDSPPFHLSGGTDVFSQMLCSFVRDILDKLWKDSSHKWLVFLGKLLRIICKPKREINSVGNYLGRNTVINKYHLLLLEQWNVGDCSRMGTQLEGVDMEDVAERTTWPLA
jgi:hypothetical protein